MKNRIFFLLSGMFLLLSHTQTEACDLDPTAVIDIMPDEEVFLVGDSIYMEAYNSSPNCGYISGYRWRVDGVTQSTSGYFIPNLTLQSGEDSRSFDIQLRVQNSVGNYGYKTVTITIVREHSSYYYLADHLGSVRVTVDDAGNSVGWDDYYPFGLQMPSRTQNQSNPNNDAKFTGYLLEQDGDLGLYHAEARMYDPVIGRFMQVDPKYDLYPEWSAYQYALNSPVKFTDPTGKCIKQLPCPEFIENLKGKSIQIDFKSKVDGGLQLAAQSSKVGFGGFNVNAGSVEFMNYERNTEISFNDEGIEVMSEVKKDLKGEGDDVVMSQEISASFLTFGSELTNDFSFNENGITEQEYGGSLQMLGFDASVTKNNNDSDLETNISFGSKINLAFVMGFELDISVNIYNKKNEK